MSRTTITVSFNDEKHVKHITWLKHHPRGISNAVREAIENEFRRESIETRMLEDIRATLDRLERRGIAIAQDAGNGSDEPEAAVIALEGLGR